jgi:hypothetical protein
MLVTYDEIWSELNTRLRHVEGKPGGLEVALTQLHDQQHDAGFINDGLGEVERYVFRDPHEPDRFFRVQYNPRRALRFAGAGRAVAPAGTIPANEGCFLCRENIRWQQRGAQFGYEIELAGEPFFVWMNPFPLLPMHVVVAAAEHRSQEWIFGAPAPRGGGHLVAALLDFADRLPGYIGYFNGVGSGASIPGHLHFHFCRRPADGPEFPLECAARRSTAMDGNATILEDYPLTGAFWRGNRQTVFEESFVWIRRWAERNARRLERLTANLIAAKDARSGEVSLYFIPRERSWNRSQGTTEQIGGLEVLGEFVFSSPVEKEMLDEGLVDYATICEWLARVRTPLYDD